jgi:hypothetical protein
MARKKLGKIDTETLLLLGAVAVGLYFFLKPSTPAVPAAPVYNPYAAQLAASQQGNTTGGIISASGSAAGSIINALGNL